MSILDQFKQTYITECFELLADMESLLLNLDCDAADNEQLNAIFRAAHSIKGGSGSFGLDYITDFTHILETLLDAMREGKLRPTREAVDMLLKSVDVVSQMVTAAKDGITPPQTLGKELRKQLEQFVGQSTAEISPHQEESQPQEVMATYDINFIPHENLPSTGNEPLLILSELAGLGESKITADISRIPTFAELNPTACYITWQIELKTAKTLHAIEEVFEFVSDYCDLKISQRQNIQENIATPNNPQLAEEISPKESNRNNAIATSIRVDLEKVDKLVNMVGELVITEAMLKAQTRHLADEQFQGLIRGIDELSQHTRELQEAVMSVRMQPVKSIFSRMPRIVRDVSAQLGKDIRLVTLGENTEVDKNVIEQLGDPLTHMIRNSVDHGIETPQQRSIAGKNPQGVIYLSAQHRGGRIVIEIRDDGAGINRSKVVAKAKEKGLIAKDAILSEEESDQLIFAAGLSTAETISNISGRGVGMDVVKRNIEALGGTITVKSELGKGSLFTVSLPLTLAILDGMIVRVGSENYIIPITAIIETLRPQAQDFHRVEGHNDVIEVRGEFIPVIYLGDVFRVANCEHQAGKTLVVLVESGHNKMGLAVDELIGQQQVVIKSLEANSDPVKGISGATILGDGRVSLILEIGDLAFMQPGKTNFIVKAA